MPRARVAILRAFIFQLPFIIAEVIDLLVRRSVKGPVFQDDGLCLYQ